jgi:hypothetical protein
VELPREADLVRHPIVVAEISHSLPIPEILEEVEPDGIVSADIYAENVIRRIGNIDHAHEEGLRSGLGFDGEPEHEPAAHLEGIDEVIVVVVERIVGGRRDDGVFLRLFSASRLLD